MRVLVVGLTVLLAAAPPASDAAGKTARAELKNGEGKAIGRLTLEQTPNGVLLRGSLEGLPPGEHAMHIHEVGKCEAPDFTSAGGHFAPGHGAHGFKSAKGPHAGDLPNVHVPGSGRLEVDVFVPRVSLDGGTANLLDGDGAAIVIHARADDYRTDPAGDAGDRIACGEIKG
jgi:Cu-Zn family superoxide dismutase